MEAEYFCPQMRWGCHKQYITLTSNTLHTHMAGYNAIRWPSMENQDPVTGLDLPFSSWVSWSKNRDSTVHKKRVFSDFLLDCPKQSCSLQCKKGGPQWKVTGVDSVSWTENRNQINPKYQNIISSMFYINAQNMEDLIYRTNESGFTFDHHWFVCTGWNFLIESGLAPLTKLISPPAPTPAQQKWLLGPNWVHQILHGA